MIRTLLKSKIHKVRVTDANLHYEGSVTIDPELLDAADILDHEQVQIYNISTGARFTTYAISGKPGSGKPGSGKPGPGELGPGERGRGEICINGAAAHLARPGELVIVASYAAYSDAEIECHRPRIIHVDEENRIRTTSSSMLEASS